MDRFPAMRWPACRRILERQPLGYVVTRQTGSHCTFEADGRPPLHLAFHDNQELPGRVIRKILVIDIGLTEDEARDLLRGDRP
jgi:predicted RNA binding protein YcfA (HicA-like mRNA interferase family)